MDSTTIIKDMENKTLKKIVVLVLLALIPGVQMQAQDWKSILKGVASQVGEKVADKVDLFTVEGEWAYVKPDFKLESDNLLSKAGGELAAKKMEEKAADLMAKVGFTEQSVFSFNNDSTYTLSNGKRTLKGTYSLNKETKEIIMTPRFGKSFTGKVVKNALDPKKMSLLFHADNLMSFVKGISGALAQRSNNKTISAANALLNNYSGAMFGFELVNQNCKF